MLLFYNVIAAVFSCLCSAHPIHVSVTEIEYDRSDQALEIMMRVFTDDLELTLKSAFDVPSLDVLHPGSKKQLDDMMKEYLDRHLRISLDGKQHALNYLGHDLDGDAIVFYIEVARAAPWKTIEIMNDVIMETYDDQSNIVHVYVEKEVKSARLTRRKPVARLTF